MDSTVAQEILPLFRHRLYNNRRTNPFTSPSCPDPETLMKFQYKGLNIAQALAICIVCLNNHHWLFHVFPRYSVFIQDHNGKHLQSLLYLASEC